MVFPIAAAIGLAAEFGPGLVRWLAGDDAGDVADKVSDVAMTVTGAPDPDGALAIARGDPKVAAELRQALAGMEVDLERAYLADRASARERDVAIQTARGRNTRADVLAFSAIAGLIGLIWLVVFVEIQAGPARDVLLLLAGALIAVVKDVYGFEFGSSRGSKEKDAARLIGR